MFVCVCAYVYVCVVCVHICVSCVRVHVCVYYGVLCMVQTQRAMIDAPDLQAQYISISSAWYTCERSRLLLRQLSLVQRAMIGVPMKKSLFSACMYG